MTLGDSFEKTNSFYVINAYRMEFSKCCSVVWRGKNPFNLSFIRSQCGAITKVVKATQKTHAYCQFRVLEGVLKKRLLLLMMLMPAFKCLAQPDEWICRIDFESQCTVSKGCDALGSKDDGNTKPVVAEFDATGKFSLCMYSGCYEGEGTVHTTEPFLSISKIKAKWTGTGEHDTNVFIVLDREEKLGMFKAASFIQPIICGEIANE
ncbi:hypothetical protein FKG94_20270 [Exilibacterium tricleocarpae]|uniref:Uncharacterized protein n=1 Tax=Exilibacterium tricleocarpae TaxID=2591008 RepID=A0A545T0E4_9GAMM|nr:hypothetical protein [Exilibacterium tricleocarpae]TQV70670.1 hypothetical protein FKG94_20270 [Exilibacterium tricleocarpae]